MRALHLISIAHDVIPGEQKLCSFCLNEREIESLNNFMDRNSHVLGHVFLSTCNRQEIYYESTRNINNEIIDWWKNQVIGRASTSETIFRKKTGNASVSKYLLELAQGFRSAIRGDDQILSQIKLAFQNSRENHRLSTLLERCFQYIMKCNKDIINTTDFKNHSVSLAFHALKSLQQVPNARNKNHKILIIGAGQMAEQILKYIFKFCYNKISITNRTKSKAESLVKNLDVDIVDYADLDHVLQDHEIVINCINGDILTGKLNQLEKEERPLFIIDLAMTEIMLNSDSHRKIIKLEKLTEELKEHNQLRSQSLPEVQILIEKYTREFNHWANNYLHRRQNLRFAQTTGA